MVVLDFRDADTNTNFLEKVLKEKKIRWMPAK